MITPLSVARFLAHGTGQRPASGGQERRTTPPVEASVRPVVPRVHPVHWHVLHSMRRQRGGADYGRAELAARRRAWARRAAAGIGSTRGGGHRRPCAASASRAGAVSSPEAGFGFCGTTVMVVPSRAGRGPIARSRLPARWPSSAHEITYLSQ